MKLKVIILNLEHTIIESNILVVWFERCSQLLGSCQKKVQRCHKRASKVHHPTLFQSQYSHLSGEAIYPTRCGSVGKEKPKHSGLPETEATQVRSESYPCPGGYLKPAQGDIQKLLAW